MQPKCLAHTLFIRYEVIAACLGRAALVCLQPLIKASPFTQPTVSLTKTQENITIKSLIGWSSGCPTERMRVIDKNRLAVSRPPWAGDLERKWQRWGTVGEFVTYPSPDTESACGWAWSEPFPSPPCRTARPLWGPSRMTPGRKSAERLSSWHRHPMNARKKRFTESHISRNAAHKSKLLSGKRIPANKRPLHCDFFFALKYSWSSKEAFAWLDHPLKYRHEHWMKQKSV